MSKIETRRVDPGVSENGHEKQDEETSKLDMLERRALMLLDIRKGFEKFPANITPEEADKRLDLMLNETLNREVSGILEQVKRVEMLREQIKRSGEELDTLVDENFNPLPGVSERFEKLHADLDHLYTQFGDINTPSINALCFFVKTFDVHKEKYRRVQELKASPERLHDELKRLTKIEILPTQISRIEFHPFEVVVVLERDVIERISTGSSRYKIGVHFADTPISLIMRQNDPVEESRIIVHESVHNFLDGLTYFHIENPVQRLRRLTEHYSVSRERGDDENVLATCRKNILNLSAKDLINPLHNEFLAELENAEQMEFQCVTGEEAFYDDILFGEDHLITKFNKRSKIFSTTGQQASDVRYELERVANESEDEQIKKYLLELKRNFTKLFVEVVERIEQIFAVSQRIGEEAEDLMHVAIIMLRPAQYDYLNKILRHRYGKDVVAGIVASLKMVNEYEKRPHKSVLEDMVSRLESGQSRLAKQDCYELARFLENEFPGGFYVTDLGIDSSEDLQGYVDLLKRLSIFVPIDQRIQSRIQETYNEEKKEEKEE